MEQLENYSRADSLLLESSPAEKVSGQGVNYGEKYKETSLATCDLVLELCNIRLGVDVTRQDISPAHRLRRKTNKGILSVVVHFIARHIRDEMLR